MTHTAGFEDSYIGHFAREERDLEQLAETVPANVPQLVNAPGLTHSYSNYGTALAGYLVEQTSGLPFAEYVDEIIARPLDMERTTFQQPVTHSIASDLAIGYTYPNGTFFAEEFIFANQTPPTAVSTTVEDMAAFMIAHLQDSRYKVSRILEDETARVMHEQAFTHHPDLPGMTLGFKERRINGVRVIGHGGDIFTFSSQLILIPQDNTGFFVGYNTFDDTLVRISSAPSSPGTILKTPSPKGLKPYR